MIQLYGKKGCMKCSGVKSILSKRDIEFTYYDIAELDDDEQKRIKDIVKEKNNKNYPLIMKDGEVSKLSNVLK